MPRQARNEIVEEEKVEFVQANSEQQNHVLSHKSCVGPSHENDICINDRNNLVMGNHD